MEVIFEQLSETGPSEFLHLDGIEYFHFEEEFMENNMRCIPMIIRFKMDMAGIKLKLLSCVHSSGKILVNQNMVEGTALEPFCIIAKDAKEFKLDFIGLQNDALTQEEFNERSQFINQNFNNAKNCKLILKLLSQGNSNLQ